MIKLKIIAQNKKASFDYFILEKYECGIILKGTEIKSIRATKVSINDSYVRIKNNEAFIINMNIKKYEMGNIFNHDETRERKLLLHKNEIIKLYNKTILDGLTIIPLKVYLKDGLCKVEIGLCKGKKNYDKREALKERDQKLHIQKTLKNYLDK